LQIWLDIRDNSERPELDNIDRYFNGIEDGQQLLKITDGDSQSEARSLIGLVEWLVLEFEDWSMIPLENLIAAAQGSGTMIAACITETIQAQGAAFALQTGVDALVVKEEILDAALIAKSLREEKIPDTVIDYNSESIELENLTIISLEEGGTGDRVCIDLVEMMEMGEGMLVSSTTKSMALIHSETVESSFVPTRPFRVNAGAVQSYVRMADGSTKYLNELKAGDEILIVSSQGKCRSAVIGRVKIERRPFILFKWKDEKHNEGVAFIQQAETVRLVGKDRETIPITELKTGDVILGASDEKSRHIGKAIDGRLEER